MTTKSSAQQRVDDVRVFRRELERLGQEGALALTAEQAARLTAYHDSLLVEFQRAFDVDHDAKAKRLSLGMRIASLLGALALAASVFFLFYQFWGLMSESAQAAILVAGAFATFLLTMWIQRRDATGYFTNLSAMVAFVCFVLNVAMLGQAFNVTPSDNALIAWAAFAFLLAYACGSRLLLAAGIFCVMGFIAARVGAWRGCYWLDLGERPENFIPAAIVLFVIPQFIGHERFPGFASVYRVLSLIALFLSLLVLAFFGQLSYFDAPTKTIEAVYQVAGFAMSAVVIWLGARRDWPAVSNTGTTFFVLFLYTKIFDWWWDAMPKWLFFLVVGLTAILGLVVLRRFRGRASAIAHRRVAT
jgi:uncharacterized membrane protein